MTKKQEACGPNGDVTGVTLKQYTELLVDAKTNEIRVQMASDKEAVNVAYERHLAVHVGLEKETDRLNELRQEVIQDRDRFVPKETYNAWKQDVERRLTMILATATGAFVTLGVVFTVIQIFVTQG